MKFIIPLTLLSAIAGALAQDTLSIDTPPSLVTCLPARLQWRGGSPPYTVDVHDGTNPNGSPLQTFPQQNGTALTWTVNVRDGTSVGLSIRDATGTVAQSASVTVQKGSSADCLGQSLSVSGGGTNTNTGGGQPTGTGSTPTGTNTGNAGSTAQTGTGNGATTGSGSSAGASTTASSSSSSNSNAASSNAQIGAAAVGAAILAFLA